MSAVAAQRGGRRSIEERTLAASKFLAGISAEDVAEQHGVTTITVHQWAKDAKEGKLLDPNKLRENKLPNGRKYDDAFRARAVEALRNRGEKTAEQVAHELGCHPSQIYGWKKEAEAGTAIVKAKPSKAPVVSKTAAVVASEPRQLVLINDPQQRIAQLEDDKTRLKQIVLAEMRMRMAMIEAM